MAILGSSLHAGETHAASCFQLAGHGSKADLVAGPGRARLAIVLLCLLLHCRVGAQSQVVGEYEVKAAFLLNFAKFVEWPPASLPAADTLLRICITGPQSLELALQQVVQDRNINGHPLQVAQQRGLENVGGCHILFISAASEKHGVTAIRPDYGPGILTVGESEGFARSGGIINFVLEQNRVSFEINIEAANRAGVHISSKLLSLARIVLDGPPLHRN
jgi:hypothetical protein